MTVGDQLERIERAGPECIDGRLQPMRVDVRHHRLIYQRVHRDQDVCGVRNMIEYRRKSGWKRIGRKADMAGETAREIAALAAGGENLRQRWLRDLAQAPTARQP